MSSSALKIRSDIRQDECEAIAASLSGHSSSLIELPTGLAGRGALGLETSVVQLVTKWARCVDKPTLLLPNSTLDTRGVLLQLALTAYGLIALALARKVQDAEGHVVPQAQVRTLVAQRLEEFDQRTPKLTVSDEGLSVVSIYGHPREHGRWLYKASDTADPVLQSRNDIAKLVQQAIAHVIPEEFARRFDEPRQLELGLAAYELLENACRHGRFDEFANPLSIGASGVTVRVVRVPFESIELIGRGSRDISLYFTRRLLQDKAKQELFLEVTVFDTGIGYHRWINAPCNDNPQAAPYRDKPERETVLDCVLRHATSKNIDGSGVGLTRVVRLLIQVFGFIRVRTGTTCLYARLDKDRDGGWRKRHGHIDEITSADVNLQDWFPEQNLAASAGTAVTICVPLTTWHLAQP